MNKNGWGLRKELGFILLFLVCILISIIGLNQFDSNSGGSEYTYKNLENKLTSAALEYYNDKYTTSSNDVVIVKYDTLYKNGYISKMKDSNDFECSGYTKIINESTALSYIKCFTYETTGYSDEYE